MKKFKVRAYVEYDVNANDEEQALEMLESLLADDLRDTIASFKDVFTFEAEEK